MSNLNQILETAIQGHLVSNSIEPDRALSISESIVADLCDQFGGQAFYLRNNGIVWIKKRQRKILDDLRDGMPKADVCQKHSITRAWLNKLEKRAMSHESV